MRRFDAFGDGHSCFLDVLERLAASESEAEVAITGQVSVTGEDEIAESAQSRHGEGFAAKGHAQARHFGESAGHDGGHGIVADIETGAGSGGDGNDIFEASAEFHTEDIVRGISAKRFVADEML